MCSNAEQILRNSLEKILNQASGRKFNKLREDIESVVAKLDVLVLGSQQEAVSGELHAASALRGNLQASDDGLVSVSINDMAQESEVDHMSGAEASTDPATQQHATPLSAGAAREIMLVLKDASDTKKPAILELVLDCLQKLMSFKLIQGSVAVLSNRKSDLGKLDDDSCGRPAPDFAAQEPQAQVLDLCLRCDESGDEAVELRLLKALLTAVTSPTLHVHGQALLLIIRACYQVYLTSRSDVNQTTAKAALTQVIGVVFQRMEAGNEQIVPPPIQVADALGLPPADASNMSAFVQQFLHDVVAAVDPWGSLSKDVSKGLDEAFVEEGHAPVSKSEEAAALPKVDVFIDPNNQIDREHIEWRDKTETGSSLSFSLASQNDAAKSDSKTVESTLQKDSFLVFRALCKLSIRSMDNTPGSDLTTIRGKILALELLKILLDNSGPIFRTSDRFISAIKQYLCLSLLKNAASNIPQVQRLCASIFLVLLLNFRKYLKAEVGVFYPTIMLKILEPSTTGAAASATSSSGVVSPVTLSAKLVVLRCLAAACQDGQVLVDLFVNYDCDLEGANLFERTLAALVRIAQGKLGSNGEAGGTSFGVSSEDEKSVRFEALSCLVSCLQALVRWHHLTSTPATDSEIKKATSPTHDLALKNSEVGEDAVPLSLNKAPAGLGLAEEQRSKWMESLAAVVGDGDESKAGPEAASADQGGNAMEGDHRQGDLLQSWKAFKRAFEEGVALFNRKPTKGIAFLQEQKLIGSSPQEVAMFLLQTKSLDKTLVGDYLGDRDDYNLKVMHAYVDAVNFNELEFDNAIRKYLAGFRLPGEAQKIDRLMEKFAERYLSCNPDSFKSADVAYVLAYSVIMLNTDAHNPGVKNKMTKADFLRNNRGINDGGDLAADFMESLYDRIINNEIKMKDLDSALSGKLGGDKQSPGGWLETFANLIPGRQRVAADEPDDEAVKQTHEKLREMAKGATFFETKDSEAVRPILNIAWAPVLGALSVLFEETSDPAFVRTCLDGFIAAVQLTSALSMGMLRSTFISSIARFTLLHSPGSMQHKNAEAFRTLLHIAEQVGNRLGEEGWQDVLRCASRWELLTQLSAGLPTDALLFAMPESSAPPSKGEKQLTNATRRLSSQSNGNLLRDSVTSIHDMGLHITGTGGPAFQLPPEGILQSIDAQELNRLFVDSSKLDSDAVVEFVATLCTIAREELRPVASPRVFSLTKLVEIAHFNMGRIRLVWNRIWAILSDFFIDVGCHENLGIAMYAVDSLRQLSMKFLERDELANFSFQNDFLRPFVVVMRKAEAPEIRELVIRCCSQMVLARVENIKSGWKTMFMVFTAAASDDSPAIVRLAFDTIERIVREHFDHITETEAATFTDAVNCLVAFTNNRHSLDVALNAIAFLRFCALRLAEGQVGEVSEIPEGGKAVLDPNAHRIRPHGQEEQPMHYKVEATTNGLASTSGQPTIQFTDRDEHMYFWFPLLAGLSELTFDPRPEIRKGSLEVLFDILKFHGSLFSPPFWLRVFDSVLLPIFDHVRAEVTDTTTFTDDVRRAAGDAWLYETCTSTLAHIVDLVATYHTAVPTLLLRVIDLLTGFVKRTHEALAGVGVAALARLASAAGPTFSQEEWGIYTTALLQVSKQTSPKVVDLVRLRMEKRVAGDQDQGGGKVASVWSIGDGAGARRLAEVKVHASVQLLLVQACGDAFLNHISIMPPSAAIKLLDIMKDIASHAACIDADVGLRHSLLMAQAADKVQLERMLQDPPLLNLEIEAATCYLASAQQLVKIGSQETKNAANAEERLVMLCISNLERFEQQSTAFNSTKDAITHNRESAALAPLAILTLKALSDLEDQIFNSCLKDLFPLLTSLISCDRVPSDAQHLLSSLFSQRLGPLLS